MSLAADEIVRHVNAQLVSNLGELASCPAQEWDTRLTELCESLRVHGPADDLLPAVVRASAVIQQFLLELATRPSDGYPVELVVHKAGWVLAGE